MKPILFDRAQKQIGQMLPGLIIDPVETEALDGENVLVFSYPLDAEWAEHILEGNYVACQDMDRVWQLYEITQIVKDTETVKATCQHDVHSLATMERVSVTFDGESAAGALAAVLGGTGWEVGANEIVTVRTGSIEHMTPLEAVAHISHNWGGELRFRVSVSGTKITNKYVDLLTRRGNVTGKRFEFGRDIKGIIIDVDKSALATALYGWGQGEAIDSEDSDNVERLTMAAVEWVKGKDAELYPGGPTSPAPVDKPLGQLWVGDEKARCGYGKFNPASAGYDHVFGEYESQSQYPETLIWETWRQLQKRNEPLVNIKATVADLEQISGFEHEKVRLGDTCYVIVPGVKPLAARVIRIERRRKNPGRTEIELGNFRPVNSKRLDDIERRQKRTDDRAGVWDRARVVNPDGTLPASILDGVIDAVQNQIRAGGGEVLMDGEGLRVLDTANPATALGKIHGVARDGEAALVLGKRESPLDPWDERVGMTSAGFRIYGEEVVGGIVRADRIEVGGATTFAEGYDPSTKETPAGAQDKADAAQDAAIDYADKNVTHKVDIFSTGGLVFKNGVISTTLIARVYKGKNDVTDLIDSNFFRWTRTSDDPEGDELWNTMHYGGRKQITVTHVDVFVRATFNCEILDYMEEEESA